MRKKGTSYFFLIDAVNVTREGKTIKELEEEFVKRYISIIEELKKDRKMLFAVGHYLVLIDKLEKAKNKLPGMKYVFLLYQLNVLDELEETIKKRIINKDKVVSSIVLMGLEFILKSFKNSKKRG